MSTFTSGYQQNSRPWGAGVSSPEGGRLTHGVQARKTPQSPTAAASVFPNAMVRCSQQSYSTRHLKMILVIVCSTVYYDLQQVLDAYVALTISLAWPRLQSDVGDLEPRLLLYQHPPTTLKHILSATT